MATMKHDSHEHELKLIERVDVNMSGKGNCGVCEMPFVGGPDPIYTCLEDDCPIKFFFLHKKCAELPTQITHFSHPQHPLTLGQYNKHELHNYSFPDATICKICRRDMSEAMYAYYCEVCYELLSVSATKSVILFSHGLCIRCAVTVPVLHHQGHEQHMLTLVARQLLSICDACGQEGADMCYTCLPCQFWIHNTCALSPPTIKLRFHQDDTLHLIYSNPYMHSSLPSHCHICKNQVSKDYWAYFCEESGYFVHITCATTLLASGNFSEIKYDEENDGEKYPDLLHFPLPVMGSLTEILIAEYHNLIEEDNDRVEDEGEEIGEVKNKVEDDEENSLIYHWSHVQHPLILLEEFKDTHNDSDHIHDMLVCNGCTLPISNQNNYYGCIGCNFFLHIFCANHLPLKLPPGKCLEDPQHSLQLLYPSKISACYICIERTNGFVYACNICSKTYDIFCCLSPKKIKHNYHNHPLVQQYFILDNFFTMTRCNACSDIIMFGFIYRCETCSGTEIHQCCALSFPETMSHRWDSHIMSLIYPPIYYKGRKYCEICEIEVNKEAWLYRCNECDQCFHPACILPPYYLKTGVVVDLPNFHHHKLTLLMIDTDRYPARINELLNTCSQGHYLPHKFHFHCLGCNYILCQECAGDPFKEDIFNPFRWLIDSVRTLTPAP